MSHDKPDPHAQRPERPQNTERGKDAFGARKIAKQAVLFRDRYLPILVKGQYVYDYDRQTHQPTLRIPEPGVNKKKPDIVDAYEAQEQRNIQAGEGSGLTHEELADNEVKAARVGLSTLFISEIFAKKHDVLTLSHTQGARTGLRYEVQSKIWGKKMVDMMTTDFLSNSPEDCLQKLKFAIAYTYQEAVQQVFDDHRKNPNSDMAQALKLYEHVLHKTEPVKKKGDKELTPELHVIRGLSTAVIEILSQVEHIADRMERGAQKAGKKLTVEMVADVVNNSYETIRKLAQLHLQTFTAEQKIFHIDGDETKPLNGEFFKLEKDRDGKLRLVLLEDAIKEASQEVHADLMATDFKDGVTGCPAMLADSLDNTNVVEEAFRVFVQKAIELYLPTRFPHKKA